MSKLFFTNDHEWIRVEGDIGTVGITDYAQRALGDVVFVELPVLGKLLGKGGEAAVVESVKAASDVFSPVGGSVVAVNETIVDQPGLVNEEAEDGAWFFKVRLSDPADLEGLMDRPAYDDYVAGLE
jgi:glycine cleavage system H protein